MKKLITLLVLSALIGCSTKNTKTDIAQSKPTESVAPKSGVSSSTAFIIKNSKNEVFFKFDSYELNQMGKDKIKEFSRILKNDKVAKINLDGYADERGTREYNFILGIKRAESVKNEFMKYGYAKENFNIISYGNSILEIKGTTEEAHSLNRKVKMSITIVNN